MGSCISCIKKKNNEYTIFNDSFSTSSTDTTIDKNIISNKSKSKYKITKP